MNKRRKLLSVLLSLALILSLMPALSIPARAAQEPVKYMDASVDPTTHAVTFTEKECTNYSVVTNTSNYLSDGWYVVKGTVTLTRSLCQGTVNLILCDGAKLTAQRGIITSGKTLNIYCQSGGTGELVAYGTFQGSNSAGIGGNAAGLGQAGPGGTVTINGGVITAVGGGQYAGIGGTKANSGGTVTINGGTVTATGGENAAGIGGGANGGGGTVTINGGTVEATGGSGAAGIGGGYNAGGGTVAIYGGTVTATGGSDAVGIGGGQMKTTESTLILGEWMALFGGSTASSAVLVPKGNDGSYARATSMKVQIAPVTPYNVWIGGVEVTSDNSSGTGWSYDSGSNTLTLNDYQYSGDGYKYESKYGGLGGNYAAIYAKQDLTISLTGESTVTNTVGEKNGYNENYGVFVDGKLTIQGEGQVTVNGITTSIRSKSLQIDSGTVNANGKKGIVVANGDVSITGGTVNAVGSGYQGSGIYVANGDVTISGGEVTAISTSTNTSSYRNGIVVDGSGKKLTIGASVTSVTFSGTDGAVRGYVVNAVAGIGWDNKEGTGTATDIGISNTARKLNDNIKKAQFPAPPAYMEATVDETTHEVTFSKKICTDYTKVTSNTTTWSDGWYVAKGEVSIGTITVNGTANLILCDGAKLTSSGQIKVEGSNVLNIYGQSAGSGSLSVKAGKNDYVAGIGGQSGKTGGTISIHGGIVTATPDNSYGGVGIGGVDGGAHVTIYGGTVTATGGRGAGIGSSKSGNGGEVTIYGGTVTASSSSSAGIGGGHGCAGSTVTIYGGTVVANGGDNGAGIGGGGYAYTVDNSGGTVTIYGGNVTATGGSEYGAGIGGGYQGAGADVTVLGGTVNATGGKFAAGIGGGSDSSGGGNGVGGTVTISGGTVTATGGNGGAGIGGAARKNGGTVTISGGTVTATGGNSSAEGIGKGQSGASSGTLTLDAGMYLYKDSVSDDNAVKKNDNGDYARSTTMIVNNVSPHTHKLTYSYSETAVTAVCDGDKSDFCEFPLVDGKHTATLTIAVPEKGGDPATADISGAAAFDETKISAITYETKQSDGTFAASAATPPEADGFHRASLTYTDGEGAHIISVTYGLNCITYGEAENGTIDGVKSAAVGAAITPTITPATGYEFDALTVAQKDNESVTVDVAADNSFVMPEYDVTVSATFKLKDFAVTDGLTEGTMTAKVGENEVTTAKMGDSVALTITPAAGYAVNTVSVKDSAEGSVDVSGENGSYSFTMPASDVTVTATYNAIDYTVTVSETTNGTVVASKTTGAHVGDEITLTITPAAGYELGTLSVKDEDENDVAVTDNKFTMPASNVTVTATFAAIDYHVTVAGPFENGTVTTTTTGAVHIGDKVTLTITPEENYGLKSVTTTAGALAQTALDEDTGVLTYELTVGAGDATVTAEFDELTTYTVFYNASGTPDAVSVKLEGGEKSYAMTNNAKLGNINCWSTQIKSGKGIDSITLSFKQSGSGEWTTLNISVADSIPKATPHKRTVVQNVVKYDII